MVFYECCGDEIQDDIKIEEYNPATKEQFCVQLFKKTISCEWWIIRRGQAPLAPFTRQLCECFSTSDSLVLWVLDRLPTGTR